MNDEAKRLVEYALSQVGYSESPKGSNKNKYAAEIDKNYPDFYNGKKNGVAWCDVFVDYCFLHCFGETKALYMLCQPKKSCGAGCKFSAEYYKAKNRFGGTAEVGSQIFFTNGNTINHTGIVYKVDSNKVYTVEGNTDDQVKTHSYSLTSKKIYGYGYPRYSKVDSKTLTDDQITKIAYDVIRGKYGNGNARKTALNNLGFGDIYSIIQKKVNSLLFKK